VGVDHKVNSPTNQPQFPWDSIDKKAFSLTQNAFNKLIAIEFKKKKKIYSMEFFAD